MNASKTRAHQGISSQRATNAVDTQPMIASAMELNIHVARALLGSLFATSQLCARCAERLQAANAETVTDLSNLMTAAVEEFQYASALPELTEACRELMAGRFLQASQSYGALFRRLFEIQADLLQQAQAAAATHVDELIEPAPEFDTEARLQRRR